MTNQTNPTPAPSTLTRPDPAFLVLHPDDRITAGRDLARAFGHLTELLRSLCDSEARMYDFAEACTSSRDTMPCLYRAVGHSERAEAAYLRRWAWALRGLTVGGAS